MKQQSETERKASSLRDTWRSISFRIRVPRIKMDQLHRKKKSDTLFALGTGSSVTTYSKEQWKHISTHDSIGFNMWILHDFIPTFYVGELPFSDELERLYIRNLLAAKKPLSNTTLLFKERKDLFKYREEIRAVGGYSVKSRALRAKDEADLRKRLLANISEPKFSHDETFYTQTASVDWIIYFALKLGYKNLVLCGVDLNNINYFYQVEANKVIARGQVPPDSGQTGDVHKTNDPERCHRGIPISKIINVYQSLSSEGAPNIKVALKSSALYPGVPCYTWPEKLDEPDKS